MSWCLTVNERILVLSAVARGLAYLHSPVPVIHRDVKSANMLLDRGCQGRIGDFGFAEYHNDNYVDITSTHMQTEQSGCICFRARCPRVTGYAICSPAPGQRDLLAMFQNDLDIDRKLVEHLDKRACWDQHKQERIGRLYDIADRCLELNRKKRPELGRYRR